MGELLAYGGESMITILTWLFNKFLQTAQIPDEWRAANIVPIYKKGDPTLAKNYRPIALTFVTRQLYERLVMGELYDLQRSVAGGVIGGVSGHSLQPQRA
jgi:hypothetical protein